MADLTIHVEANDDGPMCHRCPLWDNEWSTCDANDDGDTSERSDYDTDALSPPWCPLRAGDVVVKAGPTPRSE